MLKLWLDGLTLVAKTMDISGYKSMSKERLISSSYYESVKESERTEMIRKDFNELRDILSKPKIKEIRK